MKRFNIISLVAGLMVTGCALGMDTDFETLCNDVMQYCSSYGIEPTKTQKRKVYLSNRLRVLKNLLSNKKLPEEDSDKNNLLTRIRAYEKNPLSTAASLATTTNLPAPLSQITSVLTETHITDTRPKTAPKVFSAKGIQLHPVFIGAVALSTLAAITYTYLAKKQTKKADDIDTDLDEDTLIS